MDAELHARRMDAHGAAGWLVPPGPSDDKYSRGVVGFITGSARYPGAAVLGVEAALHLGVGMVRYDGPDRAADLVLQRRPEAVVGRGRVQAWVLGSGQDAGDRDAAARTRLDAAHGDGVPTVIDSGALDLATAASGPAVLTPHAGELARLLDIARPDIEGDPTGSARRAAERFDAVVLLKGHTTVVASPDGGLFTVEAPTSWLATAGSGDALAGILGALVATNHRRLADDSGSLGAIAAAASVIHGLAGARAAERAGASGGPFTILGLCAELPGVVAELLAAG